MKQTRKDTRTIKVSCPVRYRGNLFFLILFLIIWLPVGVLLLLKNGCIVTKTSSLFLYYHGQWGWLLFWGILFFPVSICLLLIKGVDVVEEEMQSEEEAVVDRF